MFKTSQYLPSTFNPIVIKTKYGVRPIEFQPYIFFWRYMDCTHPMQNCYCDFESDAIEWEYVNQEHNEMLLIKQNTRYSERQAQEWINSIKPTFIDKVKFYLSNLIKTQ